MKGLQCCRCRSAPALRRWGYCAACQAAYAREWRKTHPLTEEQRVKGRARSYANVYKSRGHLIQKPCCVCGNPASQMHHPDYSKPLEVEWMCRPHHLAGHHRERKFLGHF